MKQFFKGFSLQLIIIIAFYLIRYIVDLLILKYAPEVPPTTSFAKDSSWLILSFCFFIVYIITSIVISLIMILCKKNIKTYAGFGTPAILYFVYALICIK